MRNQALGTAAAALLLSGCAYSMIVDGRIDPERLRELTERTAAARHLPAPNEVPAKAVTQAELHSIFERIVAEEYSPEEIADLEWSLVTLGMWPRERSYVEESTRVIEEEIAGLYIPDERTLYVVEDYAAPWSARAASALSGRDYVREWVLAHELVHVFQHREYPDVFDRLELRGQNDMTSALQAALEGDATRYGFAAMMPEDASLPEAELVRDAMEADAENRTGGALADAPALTRLTLAFPYSRGYGLSLAEDQHLLEHPPVTTEQVLHPERRDAEFWAIDLRGLVERLPPGCRARGRDTLGELVISVLLRDLGEAESPSAWEGWDGDRYLTADCGGSREFLWWTQWDSDVDASEFARAYRGIAEAVRDRAGLAEVPTVWVDDARVLVFTPGLSDLAADRFARLARVASIEQLLDHFASEGD